MTVSNYFQETPDRIILHVTGLSLKPVAVTIQNEEIVQDYIVLEAEDLTGRFVNGYSHRFKPSTHRNSKWQRWLAKCRKNLGRKIESEADLINRYYLVEFEEWSWSGDFVSVTPVIIKEFANEVEARIEAKALRNVEEAPSQETGVRQRIVDLLDGKNANEFLQAAIADQTIASDAALLGKLASGAYLTMLEDAGYVMKDSNGIYHKK